jgi:hypothetical protein
MHRALLMCAAASALFIGGVAQADETLKLRQSTPHIVG